MNATYQWDLCVCVCVCYQHGLKIDSGKEKTNKQTNKQTKTFATSRCHLSLWLVVVLHTNSTCVHEIPTIDKHASFPNTPAQPMRPGIG